MVVPGTLLGPYKVQKRIAVGGMGEIYQALDTRLERKVAVKVLPALRSDDEEALGRFRREAKALASLSHPNILSIYDVGSDGGVNYAVMELLEGETLRARSGRLPFDRIVDIGIKVSEGLAAAHLNGIVHRDIKPENIFLTKDGGVKVLDFGLIKIDIMASENEQTHSKHGRMTDTGVVLGTPPYLSPEYLKERKVDARGDIFSLGCVLYEMVVGESPFDRPSDAEIMAAILKDDPKPFVELGIEVPEDFQNIVNHCLNKEPSERYQSALEIAEALRLVSQSSAEMVFNGAADSKSGAEALFKSSDQSGETKITEPIEIRKSSSIGEAAKTLESEAPESKSLSSKSASFDQRSRGSSKNRWYMAAGVVLLIIIGAVAFRSLFTDSAEGNVKTIAVLPFKNESGDPDDEYISDGITESLINSLSKFSKLRVMAQSRVFAFKGRNINPQQFGREMKVDTVVSGAVSRNGDDLIVKYELMYVSDGSLIVSEKYSKKSFELAYIQENMTAQISEKLRVKLTGDEAKIISKRYSDNPEAYALYLKGRHHWNKRTEESLKLGITLFQKALDLDPVFAPAYAGLADSYCMLSYRGLCGFKDCFPKCESAARKALEIDDSLAEAHLSLAFALGFYKNDFPVAERECKRAVELKPDSDLVRQRYGSLLIYTGRFNEALTQLEIAQELEPLSIITGNNIAYVYFLLEKYDDALLKLNKALEIEPNNPGSHNLLSQIYIKKGMNEKAIEEMERTRKLLNNSTEGAAYLGWAYAMTGKRAEALKILKELESASKKGERVPLSDLAGIYAALGEKDKAVDLLIEAHENLSDLLVYIKIDTRFVSLRSEPRYKDLLRRLHLE